MRTEDDFLWEMIDEYVNQDDSGDTRPLVRMIRDAGYSRQITIQHEGGNTVTGTPEQVLNHGHLKDGWKVI